MAVSLENPKFVDDSVSTLSHPAKDKIDGANELVTESEGRLSIDRQDPAGPMHTTVRKYRTRPYFRGGRERLPWRIRDDDIIDRIEATRRPKSNGEHVDRSDIYQNARAHHLERTLNRQTLSESLFVSGIKNLVQRIATIRLCVLIGIVVAIGVSTSLTLSLWWTISHSDVSGGFTLGSYVIAAFAFPVGVVGYKHSSDCHCWKKTTGNEDISLQDHTSTTRQPSI